MLKTKDIIIVEGINTKENASKKIVSISGKTLENLAISFKKNKIITGIIIADIIIDSITDMLKIKDIIIDSINDSITDIIKDIIKNTIQEDTL